MRDRILAEYERKNEQKIQQKGPEEDALFTKGNGIQKSSNFGNKFSNNRNEGQSRNDKKFPSH